MKIRKLIVIFAVLGLSGCSMDYSCNQYTAAYNRDVASIEMCSNIKGCVVKLSDIQWMLAHKRGVERTCKEVKYER
jgi:uncharacterized protein YceK